MASGEGPYYPIFVSFWSNKHFRGRSTDERLLFIYLFSNPARSVSGIYPLPKMKGEGGIIEGTGIQEERIKYVLSNLPKIIYDEDRDCIFFTTALDRDKRGGNPVLMLKAIQNEYDNTTTKLWQVFAKTYPKVWAKLDKANDSELRSESCPAEWFRYCANGADEPEVEEPTQEHEESPFLPLAKRILENALNVNKHMKSEAGYDEAKKLKGFVVHLELLGTRTWPQHSIEQVVSLANKIWDWVLTHEGSNGFRWREVILSGQSFYKGCSSHIKNGGNLIAQYEAAKNKQPSAQRGPQRPTRTSEETKSGKEVFE